ncbi:hypothetical protein Tco_0148784 [Tanacetum coccineum]
MNFKAKRSSFSRIFSLFTLDGYGKVVLVLGMTTGSSTWIIGGWTSLVLPLGSTVSFVTSVSTSTTRGKEPEFEVEAWLEFTILERIEKTKRSKNNQKPTRNGKKTKSKEQDKEISQKSQPDQPDTVKLSQRKK